MTRRRILYLFPDRSSKMLREYEEGEFWVDYRAAADRVGLEFDVAAVDHISIAGKTAYWRDEALSPERDIVIYGVRTGPTHKIDLLTGLSIMMALERLGFWLPIPLDVGLLLNDKFATLAALTDSPAPIIPTVRLTADRDVHRLGHERLVPDDWFPVIVKPTSWSGGLGCVPCPDRSALRSILGLAAGAVTGVVIQPRIPDVVADTRVVVVEGAIVAMVDRIPAKDEHVANVSRGGTYKVREEIDPRVHDLVEMITDRLDISYVCIDLLTTASGELRLCELEADGAVSRLLCPQAMVHEIVGKRFAAYERRLTAHVATRGTNGRVAG